MTLDSYTEPVALLLAYGDCSKFKHDEWPNYPDELGLTSEHIPELIRMATDSSLSEADTDSLEVWAPVHAWRSLGQLKAEVAIAPLMQLFGQDDDWVMADMPKLYAMIGSAAIPALSDYLANPSHDVWARVTAADCLAQIGMTHAENRDDCVAVLMRQLEQFEENSIDLNSILANHLLDLEAVEAASLLEQVYAAGQIDEFQIGNWANTQIELGLKQESDFSPEELRPQMPEGIIQMAQLLDQMIPRLEGLERASTDRPFKGFAPRQIKQPQTGSSQGFGSSTQKQTKDSKKKK